MGLGRIETNEFARLLDQCVHCGLCLEACPTYTLFGTEMDGPRGRIALLRAGADGRIDEEGLLGQFALHIGLCLQCRACEEACPSGVQYGTLVEIGRASLEALRKSGVMERLARRIGLGLFLPRIGWLKSAGLLLWGYERSGLQWLVRRTGLLPKTVRAMEAILPSITLGSSSRVWRYPAIGPARGRVLFFHGCIQEAFLGRINEASIRVLQQNGHEIVVRRGQTCCGAPHLHTGDQESARELARRNIDVFLAHDCDAIVNNAGGCGFVLKEYSTLLRDDANYAARAETFSSKVRDLTEFLVEHDFRAPTGPISAKAAYADSCHLRFGQSITWQPREILRSIPGLELVELRDPGQCCGSAGIYNIVYPDVADALLDVKLADIAESGADLVLTTNTGCHMQLLAGMRRSGLKMPVLHVAEILDLSYRSEALPLWCGPRRAGQFTGVLKTPSEGLLWIDRRLPDSPSPMNSLRARLSPGKVVDDPVSLITYEFDGGVDPGNALGVVFPSDSSDVVRIVDWAKELGVPIIPRGAGTGLAGGAVAERGGILIEFSHMKEIVEIDEVGRSAVVQPGAVTQRLEDAVNARGLMYPPDPASGRSSTIGGNIAVNAGGPRCFKYGVTTNYVTGLEIVLANGKIVTLAGRALDYPEYDFVGLLTGSEGTLGVVTKVFVGLRRKPPAVKTMMVSFETIEDAGNAVSALIAAGIQPASMEMMDQQMMQIVEDYASPGLPTDKGAVLIIDVDGYTESVDLQAHEISNILTERGACDINVAQTDAERERIWYGRKSAVGAVARLAPGYVIVDGTVPRSKLADTLSSITRICSEHDLRVAYVFHAGDGNLHPLLLIENPNDESLVKKVHEVGERISAFCLEQGGSITGEHGVGIEKRDYMNLMYGESELETMRDVKRIFDPTSLLNPGKILPEKAKPREQQMRSQAAVEAPRSAQEIAKTIKAWSQKGKTIRIRGGGTKSLLPCEGEEILSTSELSGRVRHSLEDLYVTARSGTTLAALQRRMAAYGMWVPLVSPWPEATIGGIVATNFNGPLRMRYGGIRDLVLAMTVVVPDGRIICLGRPVVKNVAGYDLVKLFIGSYGTLGLIVDVTFRLVPTPRKRSTLAVSGSNLMQVIDLGKAALQTALVASSVLVCRMPRSLLFSTEYTLIYTAEGLAEDVDAELQEVRATFEELGAPPPVEIAKNACEIWADVIRDNANKGQLIRAGVAPKDLPELIPQALASLAGSSAFVADLACGLLYLGGDIDVLAVRRAAQNANGYALVVKGDTPSGVDPWGYTPDSLPLMRALKRQWDKVGRFNPSVLAL